MLEKAIYKYGDEEYVCSNEEDFLASETLRKLEDSLDYFQDESITLEYDPLFPEYMDSECMESDDQNEMQDFYDESDDVFINNQKFSIVNLLKIINYYDTAKTRKFAQTQSRYPKVKHPSDIRKFRKIIETNGRYRDKVKEVEDFVKIKFTAARDHLLSVHDHDLRRWALEKAKDLDFTFRASIGWISRFKQKMKLVSRKVTKYVSHNDVNKSEDIEMNAKKFVESARNIFKSYSTEFIYNTDQSGFNYEIPATRTITYSGEKSTHVSVNSINAATHSYSIMPILALNGTLCAKLLICLQESAGSFGPRIKEELIVPENIYLCCSKSGKLEKSIMRKRTEECLSTVTHHPFVLILDSWSGQTDDTLFSTVANRCKILTIPLRSTHLNQPLDRYFFRHYKTFYRRFYEHAQLEQNDINFKNRNNIMKMHGLIFNQFQSEIFKHMWKYA